MEAALRLSLYETVSSSDEVLNSRLDEFSHTANIGLIEPFDCLLRLFGSLSDALRHVKLATFKIITSYVYVQSVLFLSKTDRDNANLNKTLIFVVELLLEFFDQL